MNLKKTLLMPQTAFEMQGKLTTKEQQFQAFWQSKRIYQKLHRQNKDKPHKILHDGPPYANGNIHVGHALNKILKDFVLRSWNLQGFGTVFIPGWDCHGLPIEHAVSKKDPQHYASLSLSEKRDLCKQFALSQIAIQKAQFQRLGLLNDFSKYYKTIDESFQQNELDLFLQAVKKDLIFQALKPTYWSPVSRTSLAEAEIEYKEVKTIGLYLTFTVVQSAVLNSGTKLLVWTTTPWTLPTNQAIAVHPQFEYLLFTYNNEQYVVLASLFESLKTKFGWTDAIQVQTISGSQLQNTTYKHCLYDKVNPVLLGNHVLCNEGTGLVHTSPAYGLDDFYLCKQNKLNEALVSLDEKGVFNDTLNDPVLTGLFYLKANDVIIERLKQHHNFVFSESFLHREPHDWRSKTPVIYRASKQLFIKTKSIQSKLKRQIKRVKFVNNKNKERLQEMLLQRAEWCISRQRVWGLPIPLIYADNQPLLDVTTIKYTIQQLKKYGIDSWFEKDINFFLNPKKIQPGVEYKKETDTLEVWFDSGSTYNVLISNKLNFPADLYLEGSDQYRGWFNSSASCGIIQTDQLPFKSLISHGFTLDEHGNKMSKSLGNVVDPLKLCDQYGADILRLWVTNVDWQVDNRIGDNIIKQIVEQYRRIRNSLLRFILGNLNHFNFGEMKDYRFALEDKIVIHKTNALVQELHQWLKQYNFLNCLKAINKFVLWLSGWYFEIIKDTLYCDAKTNPNRLAKQAVLNYIFTQLIGFLNIFIPHTAEDAWQNYLLPKKPVSVNLFAGPAMFKVANVKGLDRLHESFSAIKDRAYAAIEQARQNGVITKNNQVVLTLGVDSTSAIDQRLVKHLAVWLNVNQVNITNDPNEIKVEHTDQVMCERCWNFQTQIYPKKGHQLCARCFTFLKR
ncbi:isoleucine--tRNA ligase [Mycoplasmoides pneumoniae]|uniref:isoleucine--tRNA ligase n=1 Tax=Mycoplasmoides pneumoniae TaxID=2104 RepID=UPI0033060C27